MDQFDSAIREIYENYYYEEDVETVLGHLARSAPTACPSMGRTSRILSMIPRSSGAITITRPFM